MLVADLYFSSGKCMQENTRYKFFLRGWLSDKRYRVFSSDDIAVLASGPQVLQLAGSRVREVDPLRPDHDLNFVGSSLGSVRVTWPKQFRARIPNSIASCSVGLGTFCGGEEPAE